MNKYIILIGFLVISVLSCDLGMVDVMDFEEYGDKMDMEVLDVEFRLYSVVDRYQETNEFDVYIRFDDYLNLNSSQILDLKKNIMDNIQVENASVSAFYYTDIYNSESREYDHSLLKITIIPGGQGNIEITIPEKTIKLSFNKDDYLNRYNKEASETLVIPRDLLYPYSKSGLDISRVCWLSAHEYLVVDTENDKILVIDSDSCSVTRECSISLDDISDMEYSADKNVLYILSSSSLKLTILDVGTLKSSTETLSSTYSPHGKALELDTVHNRIYILTNTYKLYSLDMDDYSVKINSADLPLNINGIALDAEKNLLYTANSKSVYRYSVAGDTVSEETSSPSSSISHVQLVMNGDGSKIYYADSDGLHYINTSDLSESSFEGSGEFHAILPESDLLFTSERSYPNLYLYKYKLSDHSLISTTNLGYIDGYAVNKDGTEALVYEGEYSYSSGIGHWEDYINFEDL